MDFENIIYVLGAIFYFIYQIRKGFKDDKENKPRRPQPNTEHGDEKRTSGEDILKELKEIMMERSTREQVVPAPAPTIKVNKKKAPLQSAIYSIENDPNARASLRKVESININILQHQEVENRHPILQKLQSGQIEMKDVVIFSEILKRPEYS